MVPALSIKGLLKIIKNRNIENKKLVCFGTSGGPNYWARTCRRIQK